MPVIRTVIVDDEARIRRGIERLLMSCEGDWEIVAVLSNGVEALDYIQKSEGAVDLLITDVKMPEMDGLTLIKEARRNYSFYPIMISGYNDFEYVQNAIREGAIDYILKPLDREQFRLRMAEVKEIIDNSRRKDQRWNEMKRKETELKRARQTQMLSFITSAGLDMSRLGYWVEDFPKGQFMLLYISLDPPPVRTREYSSKDWEAFDYVIENIITEVTTKPVGGVTESWCWKGGNAEFWVLLREAAELNGSDGYLSAIANELSAQIRSAIQLYTPFSVSVSFGNQIDDLYMLPEAKQKSLSLMNYRFVGGGNKTFRNDMQDWSDGRLDQDLIVLAHRLRITVEQTNRQEALSLCKQFFTMLSKVSTPFTIQRAFEHVWMLIHSTALEFAGSSSVHSLSLEKGLHMFNRSAALDELKQELEEFIRDVMDQIRLWRESGSMKPVEQAKEWIIMHLETDLTIKSIADHVYMNPSYFSRIFKLQTGVTILEYITELRMEKAKELLSYTTQKVQEICEQVGYQDVKYFSRQFKQRFGETPSKFREQKEEGTSEAFRL